MFSVGHLLLSSPATERVAQDVMDMRNAEDIQVKRTLHKCIYANTRRTFTVYWLAWIALAVAVISSLEA
jgi:hypothetical protein